MSKQLASINSACIDLSSNTKDAIKGIKKGQQVVKQVHVRTCRGGPANNNTITTRAYCQWPPIRCLAVVRILAEINPDSP